MVDTPDWRKPTIRGELVVLRPFVEHDIDAAWEMINDPTGNELTATTETFTFEQIQVRQLPPELCDAYVPRMGRKVHKVLREWDVRFTKFDGGGSDLTPRSRKRRMRWA